MNSKGCFSDKIIKAAKLARQRHFKHVSKKPRLRHRPNDRLKIKKKLTIDIPFTNFEILCVNSACKNCKQKKYCIDYYNGKYCYDLLIKQNFQIAIKQTKSEYRKILGYKHRGGYEKYVIRAFRKNFSMKDDDPKKLKYFSPFDMLSETKLEQIISITKQSTSNKIESNKNKLNQI